MPVGTGSVKKGTSASAIGIQGVAAGDKYLYSEHDEKENRRLGIFIGLLNRHLSQELMNMTRSQGGTISDFSPMLKVLCQAMTLEGVKQGQYVTVMPDLAAPRLQELEAKINGSLTNNFRAGLRREKYPPPFIKDLQW